MTRFHARWSRALIPVGLVAALLLLSPLAAVAEEEAAAPPAGPDAGSQFPLTRVLLFSSGVGFFEHRADVQGDARLQLLFRANDINDLLKSLVVEDLGGGRISTVTYGSRDPIAKALQSFAIDLTNNVSMADLLAQVRGAEVYVETPMPLRGTIVSVESRPQRVKDEILQVTYLNLLTQEGLRSVSFDQIRSLRLLDKRLDAEMRKALEILSLGRDSQKKTVTLEFLGEGSRDVRVGYIRETPVWKTSYRLVLDDAKRPFVQGWAIVENTTDQDWEDIDLTLVSGRPISYVMNLYQPLYAHRPVLDPPVRAGVGPQAYDRDMAPREKAKEERKAPARGRARRAGSARPGAPMADARMDSESGDDADAFEIARGVEAAATAAELGELFQYRIDAPVSLNRQRSAMLPILNQEIDGRKISIYDPAVHAKHPLNAVQLVNSTDVHLMQGPVTVFDGGAYAGDALLGDLPPGAKRILSYAMDLEVEVSQEGRSAPDELKSVAIVKGTLQTRHLRRREKIFVARNADRKARLLLVAVPFDPNWTLMEPKQSHERTRNQYRFQVDLKPGETQKLAIAEEQTRRETIGLSNLNTSRIAYYLQARAVSSNVKEALAEVVRKKQEIDELGRSLRALDQQLKAISQEQARIRENMAQIDHGTELYTRYLKKFSDQEDQVEALRTQMLQTRKVQDAKAKALDTWLIGLNLN
jgi:hypothetical protein